MNSWAVECLAHELKGYSIHHCIRIVTLIFVLRKTETKLAGTRYYIVRRSVLNGVKARKEMVRLYLPRRVGVGPLLVIVPCLAVRNSQQELLTIILHTGERSRSL